MICSSADNNNKCGNIEDDSLLSLLTSPLFPLDHAPSASPFSSFRPSSFEDPFDDPFDDPRMEPLPFRPQGRATHNAPLMQSMSDAYLLSCFMERLNNSKTNGTKNLRQAEDLIGITSSKRRSQDSFSNNHQDQCKRQRMNHAQTAHDEESTARFRPYQGKQWRAQFQKLIQYKLKNGHCCVPHAYAEDPVLARWVKRQRYQYKKFQDCDTTSTMTTRRIQQLESIGFVWQSHALGWQEKLNELKAFKQRTGHYNVPSDYPENSALATWVKCQRRQYKVSISSHSASSTMTMHRFQVLESLGFVFEPQLSKRRDT